MDSYLLWIAIHDRSRSIIIQVGWNSWFMIFFLWSWDSSWMDPASFKHDSSIIFKWFWAHFDMFFWWFSYDFLNILEWSQKHFCKSSGAVLEPPQNRSYRALVNRNPGFQAQLRSWYRPEDPRPTSISMGSRKVPVFSRWMHSFKGLTWPLLLTISDGHWNLLLLKSSGGKM